MTLSSKPETSRAMMSDEAMLAVVQRHADTEYAGDYAATLETMTEDCFWHFTAFDLRYEGKAAGLEQYRTLFGAFPDLHGESEGYATGPDVLVSWGKILGTMEGPWLGIPATGGALCLPAVTILPFRDGLMVGERVVFDGATFCEQLRIDRADVRRRASAVSGRWARVPD